MAGVTVTPYFTPTSITGCRLWLDAADPAGNGVIPANASSLSTWVDKSGNGNNATANGTPATYNTNAVVFAGAQNYGTSLSSTLLTQSAFAVISYTGSAYMDIISVRSTGGSAGLQQIISNGSQRITSYGGAVVGTGSAVTASTIVLYNYTFNSGSSTFIYLNGTQTGTSTGSSISGSGTISIGSYDNNGGAEPFTGNMYELILFNVVLTTTQRQQVESYLAQKWNFTSSLPAGHPGINSILFRSLITPVKVTAYSSVSFAFAPTQITGCQLWLDASDTTTITSSSGTLSQWRDKSTNALVMGQLGGTAFPTVSTAVSPNGLQTVNFTSSQSLASTGNLTLNGPVSIFIVFNAPSGTSMFFLEHGFSGSGTTLASGFYIFGGNGTYWDLKRNGTERCASIGTVGSAVFSNNTWYQTGFVDADATTNTSDLAITRNGSSLTPSWYNAGQGLGSIASGSFSAPFYINPTTHVATATYYGEIIIYNTALGVSDRQKVESYLSQKWGVQSSLAASHPGLTVTHYVNQSFLSRAASTIPVAAVKTTGSATGGTVSTANGYRTHSFTTVGSTNFVVTGLLKVQVLVVGGGGAGASGYESGGGGAGGSVFNSGLLISAGTYSATVGNGGAGRVILPRGGQGESGTNSSFLTLTGNGGGGGGNYGDIGEGFTTRGTGGQAANGGCGGGGGGNGDGGVAGTAGSGNQGYGGGTSTNYGGSGGGGMGSAGSNATTAAGASGGLGLTYQVGNQSYLVCGGGGGGSELGAAGGSGGSGIGGNGGVGNNTPNGTAPTNGAVNTGSGGGGSYGYTSQSHAGGNGGIGIVIIAYAYP